MLGLKNHLLWSQTTYPHSYFSDFHVIFMVLAWATRHFFPQFWSWWSQYWKVGMQWIRKVYAHWWHIRHQEHKAAVSQMAERINAQFAHTKKMFLWQGVLNYTQGKFHPPLKKKRKINILLYKYIFIPWLQGLLQAGCLMPGFQV